MDIRQHNMTEGLEAFKAALKTAKFAAIDLEMSGITHPYKPIGYSTGLDQRYDAMVSVSSDYNIIQFGICLAHEDEDGRIQLTPFNIYTFPDGDDNTVKDRDDIIRISSSTMSFLKEHNMDFNVWIKEGLPLVRRSDIHIYNDKLAERCHREDSYQTKDAYIHSDDYPTFNKPLDTEYVNATLLTTEKWLDSIIPTLNNDNPQEIYTCDISTPWMYRMFSPMVESILAKKYKHCIIRTEYQRSGDNNEPNKLIIRAMTLPEHLKYISEKKNKYIADHQKKLGLQLFWSSLVQSKLPIVAHNCLYDLTFLYNALEGPLPSNYNDFANKWTEIFPITYDTKYIALHPEVQRLDTHIEAQGALGPLFKAYHTHDITTNDTPHCYINPEYTEYTATDEKMHEGGFDALMTAELFALLIKAITIGAPGAVGQSIISQCESKVHSFRAHYHFNLLNPSLQLKRFPSLSSQPELQTALTSRTITWFNYPSLPIEQRRALYVVSFTQQNGNNLVSPVSHLRTFLSGYIAPEMNCNVKNLESSRLLLVELRPPPSFELEARLCLDAAKLDMKFQPFTAYMAQSDQEFLIKKQAMLSSSRNNTNLASNKWMSMLRSWLPSTRQGLSGMIIGASVAALAIKTYQYYYPPQPRGAFAPSSPLTHWWKTRSRDFQYRDIAF